MCAFGPPINPTGQAASNGRQTDPRDYLEFTRSRGAHKQLSTCSGGKGSDRTGCASTYGGGGGGDNDVDDERQERARGLARRMGMEGWTRFPHGHPPDSWEKTREEPDCGVFFRLFYSVRKKKCVCERECVRPFLHAANGRFRHRLRYHGQTQPQTDIRNRRGRSSAHLAWARTDGAASLTTVLRPDRRSRDLGRAVSPKGFGLGKFQEFRNGP